MMGHIRLRPGGAISGQTAAQQRDSLRYITILEPDPAVTDRSVRTPEGKSLLGRHRNHLVHPLAEARVVSDEQKQHGATSQGHSQRRRMSQSPSLDYGRVALC